MCLPKDIGIDSGILENTYKLVIAHFNKKKDVNADGIYVLGALVSFLPNENVLSELWPFVNRALERYNESILMKAALSCITSMVHRFKESMASRLTFIDSLLAHMNVLF